MSATVRCITFDLDDTLWDVGDVIEGAETGFYDWLAERHPHVARRFAKDELTEHRRDTYQRFPHLRHDFTALRKLWLGELAREFECHEDMVEEGFRVFWELRNSVRPFERVPEILDRLGARYRIGAVTNGNADVHHIGIGHLFDFVVTAAGAGAAKPEAAIFHAALAEAQTGDPREVVHVGDDPERDVMGAAAVGMRTVWVNTRGEPWRGNPAPDAEVRHVEELFEILDRWT